MIITTAVIILTPVVFYGVPAGLAGLAAYSVYTRIINGSPEPSSKVLSVHWYKKTLHESHTVYWEKIKLYYEKTGNIQNSFNTDLNSYNYDKKRIGESLEQYYQIKKSTITGPLKFPEDMSTYEKLKLIVQDCKINENNLNVVEQTLLAAEGKLGMVLDSAIAIASIEGIVAIANGIFVLVAMMTLIYYWRNL